MSYDLVFWRQDVAEAREPRALYKAFAERQRVDGVPELPADEFIAALIDAFPSATRTPNGDTEWVEWTSPDDVSSFQVEWTDQCVWVTLRPLHEDRANRIIEIAHGFGCALYDPQTNGRFDS